MGTRSDRRARGAVSQISCAYCSFFDGLATGVRSVERVEDVAHRGKELVIIGVALSRAGQYCFEAGGFAQRNAARIERADHFSDAGEGGIGVQPKAFEQYFEGDELADVREACAVEIEAQGLGRQIARMFQPYKVRTG